MNESPEALRPRVPLAVGTRHEVVDRRVFIQGEELAVLLPARALSAVPRMQTSQSH
jgi:hypothetical protein